MKVVRHFIHIDHKDTGRTGFVPLWVPRSGNFDPSSSMSLLLHDSLEHRLCDSGKLHEEAMAFGRLLALRVVHGGSGQDSARSLGAEFGGVMARAYRDDYSGDLLQRPPKVGRLFDWSAREEIHVMVAACQKTVEYEVDSYGEGEMPDAEMFTRFAQWLMIGFTDAHRRYGGPRGCSEMGHLIDSYRNRGFRGQGRHDPIADLAAEGESDWGTGDGALCLRLNIDTDTAQVKVTPLRPTSEHGTHAGWLRQRIRRWYTA